MTTETGHLIGMVEDLMLVAAGVPVIGDDAQQHRLAYGGDGASPAWSCTCGGWAADADDVGASSTRPAATCTTPTHPGTASG